MADVYRAQVETDVSAWIRIGEISRELEKAQTIRTTNAAEVRLPDDRKSKSEALAQAGIAVSTAHDYEQLTGGREAKIAAEKYFAKQKQALFGRPVWR